MASFNVTYMYVLIHGYNDTEKNYFVYGTAVLVLACYRDNSLKCQRAGVVCVDRWCVS